MRTKNSNSKQTTAEKKRRIIQLQALLIFIFGAFLMISLLSFDSNDTNSVSLVHNWGGKIGALISSALFSTFGKGAYLIPFIFMVFSYPFFRTCNWQKSFRQSWPMLLLFLAFQLLLSAAASNPLQTGGTFGNAIANASIEMIGKFGTFIFGILFILTFLILFFNFPFLKKGKQTKESSNKSFLNKEKNKKQKEEKPPLFQGSRIFSQNIFAKKKKQDTQEEQAPTDAMIFKAGIPRKELLKKFKEQSSTQEGNTPLITKVYIEEERIHAIPPVEEVAEEMVTPEQPSAKFNFAEEPVIVSDPPQEEIQEQVDPEPIIPKTETPLTQKITGKINTPAEEQDSEKETTNNSQEPYRSPDSSLLFKSQQPMDDAIRSTMTQNAEILEQTFFEFGIEAKVTNICRGPVITRFEMSVPPGVKLNRVVALQDNIALSLAAASVRIEAPIPGKSAIGIEVPNKKRSMVTIRDILESEKFTNTKATIPIALGQTVSGSPMVTDMAAMPHLIIAGTTGSGKSVCVNSIICSILYNMSPEQVRLILVDPKYVELAPYNGIPHLLTPVINKPRTAVLALKWLVSEMESRYIKLQQIGARNIASFNERVSTEKIEIDGAILPYTPMPYLIVVIDELADLMILAAKEIEDSISRLAAMSRAVGIHLIFATQRPSVDVITGVIKNNFPARIAFQVASATDSRTIIDSKGADKLLGKGDCLFIGPGSPFPQRIQGAFLSEEEVDKTAAYLRSLGDPEYNMDIVEEPTEEAHGSAAFNEDEPLFADAVNIVLSSQRASASYIQRRLKVGYNRAARMIEMMEEEGIIGPQQGSKPRDILVSSWEES